MNFYENLGYLVFGSRLRRLSESFLADVNKIYQAQHITFDASWFPIFFILSLKKEVSIRDISDELAVSHSAISQLISNLQEKGLIKTIVSEEDARKKVISFTPKGKKLQLQIEPIWNALTIAMQSIMEENKHSKHILKAITEIEQSLITESLFNRVQKVMD